ncbi:MAG: flagellar biosynthetic protein FliR [Hydrogenophilales bacterium CG17_big_fil_post_rev_8_21_14_2_50_63_12]|nr:MAG: flagellar biosynthetic protein FliR [Hydrogenophilales bacterium CG17_big_fil_post_rev_8_21_14_2_50_63_12]PIX96327.1 MAG: flagellar biosynthetic protein FliR [Hydrogenophilales bacterium CG_4_10_14_3_um_filter_63_21]PJB05776.1 MAG: flagellar biosynthetic protein FliR [Hydrogenophilales bacterium CG_4_9_14_3_um_filter_63_34]
MFTLSSTDLDALLVLFFFPFVRILAWLGFDPLLGNRAVPMRMRVAMAFVLTVAIAPILPAAPQVALASGEGLLLLLQQIVIGAVLGFSLRIVFAIIEVAGAFMGMQMGLSFATFFDPINGAQTPVVAQFLVLTTTLILFAFNGHHLVIAAIAQSFVEVPIGAALAVPGFAVVVHWGGAMFATGLHIALPVTAALLATNLTIGMMSRAAPQLNIFAVGFPLTLGAGFVVLYFTLAYLPAQLDRIWLQALEAGVAAMRGVSGQ